MVVAATASPEKIGLPPFVAENPPFDTEVEVEPHAKPGLSEETLLLSLAHGAVFHRAEIKEGPDRKGRNGRPEPMPAAQLALHLAGYRDSLSSLALAYPTEGADESVRGQDLEGVTEDFFEFEGRIIPINPDSLV